MNTLSNLTWILSVVDIAGLPIVIGPESPNEVQGIVDVGKAELDIESLEESVSKVRSR
jgi:hypothetical protein